MRLSRVRRRRRLVALEDRGSANEYVTSAPLPGLKCALICGAAEVLVKPLARKVLKSCLKVQLTTLVGAAEGISETWK